MKKRFLLALLTISSLLFSDSDSINDIFNKRKESFKKTRDQKISDYNLEREKRDLEFNNRLKESWEIFSTRRESTGLGPKPDTLPVAKKVKLKNIAEPKAIIAPYRDIEKAEENKAEPRDFLFKESTKKIVINFYQDRLKITYPRELLNIKLNSINDSSISRAWEKSSKCEYAPLLTQIENYINQYRLNPWGTYKLVNKIGEKIYKNQANRVVFTGFILSQLGMNCKIAHSGNVAYLLLPSNNPLYGKAFLNINGVKFYIITPVNGKLEKIKTYTAKFPGVPTEFDLTIKNLPLLKETMVNKRLSFEYNGDIKTINTTYNKNLIDFFEDYPQTHYQNYFNTKLSPKTRDNLVKELKPIIEGKGESEAVNILLHFVQKSFEYKTDQEQFNREKPLFPEETLHYRYSDCEDRSVLFTYLVKELLGLEVVGLKYPGHMSSGVLLKEVGEDSVNLGNKTFTIADPTFINANIGMAMPTYKNRKPEIIGIN